MTNRDRQDRIRARMTETGETYNVARRSTEAAAAGEPEPGGPYELIEVEVGDHDDGLHSYRRHTESFWGRWVIKPDPATTGTAEHGHPRGAYYGVAQTRRGRIAAYTGMSNPAWRPSLKDYSTLAEARLPADIRRRAAATMGLRDVVHRDI